MPGPSFLLVFSLCLVVATCHARPQLACFQQQTAAFVWSTRSSPNKLSTRLRLDDYENDETGSWHKEETAFTTDSIDVKERRALEELKDRAKSAGQLEMIKAGAGTFAKITERLGRKGGRVRLFRRAGGRAGKKTIQKTGRRAGSELAQRAGVVRRVAQETSRSVIGQKAGARAVKRAVVARKTATSAAAVARDAGKGLVVVRQSVASCSRVRGTVRRIVRYVSPHDVTKRMLRRTRSRIPKRLVLLRNARKGGSAVMVRQVKNSRRLLSASTRRIALRRFGRGLLIALPALGGIFAVLTLQSDWGRVNEELETRSDVGDPKVWSLAFILFMAAVCADYIDTLCHILISRNVLVQYFRGRIHNIMVVDSVSMACAIVSTVGAVAGEVASQRRLDSLLCEQESASQLQ